MKAKAKNMAERPEEKMLIGDGLGVSGTKNILSEETLKARLAPDGMDPNPLDHFVISDMGHQVYIRSFYIEELPKRVTFATTFRQLFNTPNVTSSVFIRPMAEGRASKLIDKKIRGDETELIGAQKSGDRNRARKLEQILARDEEWASQIETGNNKLFEVAFLFSLKADSLEKLNVLSGEFVSKARETSVELCSCYGMQLEAYMSNAPYNRMDGGVIGMLGAYPAKRHPLDKYALATIFNHTNTYFSHPTGIPAGRNMGTNEPILWDPYVMSHNGYSCIFVGKTGTGKSATIKIFVSRLAPFGYRFGCIDTDKVGGRGEYSNLCEAIGGVNYVLRADSPNRLNIFEIDEQEETDHLLGITKRVLHVANKCAEVTGIIMSAIIGEKAKPDFETQTYMEKILKDCTAELYAEHGIIEGQPDSLYEDEDGAGLFASGHGRKDLPVISELFLKVLRLASQNRNPSHVAAYQLLADSLADMVDSCCYDADTLERVSREEYEQSDRTGRNIRHVHGTRGYFDGQSSIAINRNIPFINVDISDLSENDKFIGQQVAMSFLMEHFIKKNAETLEKAQRIVLIVDEAHRMFPYELSRRFLCDQVRTARKNNASMWISTQNLSDFSQYSDTENMLKQITSKFLLKQDSFDKKYLAENTVLTAGEISRLLKLGGDTDDPDDTKHKGEICLIDNDKVVFLKVDYLFETEAPFVESDVSKLKKMMERG